MLHLRVFEPIGSEAFAQGHARAMEHNPEVAVGNRKRGADFLALDFIHFAHHEDGGDALRQLGKAITHRLPEFVAMHDLRRIRRREIPSQ